MIILFLVFTFNIGSAFSQTAVTLFEFGSNRLAFGSSTRPLSPLGTASDNSQTTYLYEVVNHVEATSGAKSSSPKLETVSRTIVASASGWAEHFDATASIECKFIGSTEGICFGQTTGTATGTPSPVVLKVASTTPAQATNTAPTSALSTTPTTESQPNPTISPTANTFQNSRKSSAGIIAGSTIAELLVEQFNSETRHPPMRNSEYRHLSESKTSGSDGGPISSQIEKGYGYSFQPQSKRQTRMTDVVDRLVKRQSEEHSLVSDHPPSYVN
ncbi:hypothetical protein BDP27DRAFT_1414890 [Rhodocollybia butyracea]|uniref:Uncharacterized protein n=1 Tax=Rhodocollybia butyracea TaxID=206335 RepID=A0A9P5Q704_9AGAR|nr:hypothetical protein BDP27DRAFT_1414890 [Rhodocollybia butyracea]